jgi:nitrogen fixation NifU-like protein
MEQGEPALDELYREVVLDHHRHPRGRSPLPRVDATAHGFNPVCGDDVVLSVALANDTVGGVQVTGRGCAICTASGSMLAELVPGRSIGEAETLTEAFRTMMHGGEPPAEVDMGDLPSLQGVRSFALRIKCAMLPWVTLEQALRTRDVSDPAPTATTEGEELP